MGEKPAPVNEQIGQQNVKPPEENQQYYTVDDSHNSQPEDIIRITGYIESHHTQYSKYEKGNQ
jgi:hypothetical protein